MRTKPIYAIFCFVLAPLFGFAQSSLDYSVPLSVTVSESPVYIKLTFPQNSTEPIAVYRKKKSDVTFGTPVTNLAGGTLSYTDSTAEVGKVYEYGIRKNAGSYYGYGYVFSGINAPATDVKGKLILLVDSAQANPLSAEINRLTEDLEGEGWSVIRFDVSPNDEVTNVKALIQGEYNADPQGMKAVFILGHVPVPYSGNLAPDGHPDHIGAWPSDSYYGEMDGVWTDQVINNASASDPRNQNIPNDGKFDQSIIPTSVELQVGRVDMHDMPAFSADETELLRRYLKKNHAYRTGDLVAVPRGLVRDNFGGFNGEAFAASAWKSFSPLVGPDSVFTSGDYFGDLSSNSYLWSYGCGAGTYTSAGGVGNTNDFASDSLQTIFTALFGSYFGDWDKTNSFLRAPLAQGWTLTNAWSGRPHWHFHHMGLGENIGYSYLTAVNAGPYETNFAAQYVHIALMGDPTLKMYIVKSPSNLQLNEQQHVVDLGWVASPDNVEGYYIFRKRNKHDVWTRISEEIVVGTTYSDSDLDSAGTYYYSVRAVKLETTPSGSFYNLSGGANGEIETLYIGLEKSGIPECRIEVFPNPTSGEVTIQFNEIQKQNGQIDIFSMEGKLVKTSILPSNNGRQMKMDVGDLNKGIYLIRFTTESISATEKLIISK